MFCPQCGAEGQRADAYCKRCGAWLPDMPGIIRRALWGQGIKPEQKIKMMLTWQALSILLALCSAITLLASGSSGGGSKMLVYVVACMCLAIAGLQLDSFFVTLRMRQNLRLSRMDAERAVEPSAASGAPADKSYDVSGAGESTTRRLDTERTRLSQRVE
jgi:hypothetical protein